MYKSCLWIALSLTVACNSGKSGKDDTDVTQDDTDIIASDTDVVDTDTTPATGNVLNGTFTGGHASVVEIVAVDVEGAIVPDGVFDDDLTLGCENPWAPQGTLCDQAPSTDSPTTSSREALAAEAAATWNDAGTVGGVLVIDACSDGACTAVEFSEIRTFQAFSDGKTTGIRVLVHSSTGDTAPAWDDAGWTEWGVGAVGAGTGADLVDGDDAGVLAARTVTDPAVLTGDVVTTRYVQIDALNDGTIDASEYTELRQIKAFMP